MEIKQLASKLLRSFKSARFTASVIALLIFVYMLGLVIPQKWMFQGAQDYEIWLEKGLLNRALDFIGLTSIYTSPITLVLLAVFFANLITVIINRVPVVLRRAHLTGPMPEVDIDHVKSESSIPAIVCDGHVDMAFGVVSGYLNKRGYWVFASNDRRTITALKNRYSPIGFLMFHVSFLLCLIGAVLIFYTRFSGNIALAEGQSFEGDIRQFYRIVREPKLMQELPELALRLISVVIEYEKDVPSKLEIAIDVNFEGSLTTEKINVNQPLTKGPISIVAESIGITPLFKLTDSSGSLIDGAYVSLNVLNGNEDSFMLDSAPGYNFVVRFYPNYVVEDGFEKTLGREMKNPAMHLIIRNAGNTAYEGTIKLGGEARFDGYTLTIGDLRYWADLLVVREYGQGPLVTGFLLALTGLVMRLIFYQKRLKAAFETSDGKTLIYIGARSEYFGDSFLAEANGIASRLQRKLKEGR